MINLELYTVYKLLLTSQGVQTIQTVVFTFLILLPIFF